MPRPATARVSAHSLATCWSARVPAIGILAGSFEPQLFFYAERAFAGGQVYLKGGWHDSEDAQKLTIERLQRQRVPIVIINAATEPEVQSRFPLVYQHVQKNYREASRANDSTRTPSSAPAAGSSGKAGLLPGAQLVRMVGQLPHVHLGVVRAQPPGRHGRGAATAAWT